MKTIIYYFSATGNSLAAARGLAQELGDAKVFPITKALSLGQDDTYDAVGIVFPVYMFGLPLIVAEFLKILKVKKDAYVFSVATLGGLPGRSFSLMKKILKARGIDLAAGFCVRMPGNYIPLYGALDAARQQKLFLEEKKRVKFIADYVLARKRGTFEEKPFLVNFLLYKLLYNSGSAKIPCADTGFWATAACTKCGLCADVCPVANIKLVAGVPQWLHHCQQCMACLQWCPVEAIQYKKSTQGRKRYRHPQIAAHDIMEQR